MSSLANFLPTGNRRLLIIVIALLLLPVTTGVAILGVVALRTPAGTATVGQAISFLGDNDKTPWYLSRSAGTVAYLLLVGSSLWGLLLSSKIVKEAVTAALALAMHNILSWLALAFTGFHALVLLFDNYYTYRLADLTIPFGGPYRPGWVGLGIVGFYLMLLVVLSFQFHKQLGQKRWRTLHYLSFAIYVLATIHGIAAGTDSSKLNMQIMYLGSGLPIFFLTCYRLLTRKGKPVRRRAHRLDPGKAGRPLAQTRPGNVQDMDWTGL